MEPSETPIDPGDDLFACSRCGCYPDDLEQVRGTDYCDHCLSEMGFAVAVFSMSRLVECAIVGDLAVTKAYRCLPS